MSNATTIPSQEQSFIKDKGWKSRFFSQIPYMVSLMGLSVYAVTLYVYLKYRTGESGECWESCKSIAHNSGLSDGSVSRAKQELAAAGLIEIDEKHVGRGRPSHNIYIIDIWKANDEIMLSENPKAAAVAFRLENMGQTSTGEVITSSGEVNTSHGEMINTSFNNNSLLQTETDSDSEILPPANALVLPQENSTSIRTGNGNGDGRTKLELRQQIGDILRSAGIEVPLEVEIELVSAIKGNGGERKVGRTAQEVKASLQGAITRGANKTELLKEQVEKAFRKNYLWNNRYVRDTFLPWLREQVVSGNEIKRFADWWYENDWRGKTGQSPTLAQIYEYWPQAFPQVVASEPENVKFRINSRGEAVSSSSMMGGRYFTPIGANGIRGKFPVIGYTRDDLPVYRVDDESILISNIQYRVQHGAY